CVPKLELGNEQNQSTGEPVNLQPVNYGLQFLSPAELAKTIFSLAYFVAARIGHRSFADAYLHSRCGGSGLSGPRSSRSNRSDYRKEFCHSLRSSRPAWNGLHECSAGNPGWHRDLEERRECSRRRDRRECNSWSDRAGLERDWRRPFRD